MKILSSIKKSQSSIIWNLFILFQIILVIKTIPILIINGPFILPDEPCSLLKASHFIKNFSFESCTNLTNLPAGDPQPLYAILISPIYKFFSDISAYRLVLFLNAILVSSLVFPLHNIFKKFTKNTKAIFFFITVFLFLPQITVFEKTAMTETLFIVINIWMLYFYTNSFGKKQRKNKIVAIILSIFAIFTRPFGFMVPIALTINEIIISKRKKITLFILLPTIILLSLIALLSLNNIGASLLDKITSLSKLENWQLIFKAIVSQINSFSIATYMIPIVIFFTFIFKSKDKNIKNIKWFLIVLLLLNFLISAQHIYGYYLAGHDPNLLTRYVSLSITLILLYTFIFLAKKEKFELNSAGIISIGILALAFLFFKDEGVKHSLNFDLSIYHFTNTHFFGSEDIVESNKFLGRFFTPIILILFSLFILKKRKSFLVALSIILITTSIASIIWASQHGSRQILASIFADSQENVTFIMNKNKLDLSEVWLFYVLTDIDPKIIHIDTSTSEFLKSKDFEKFENFNNADFIITKYNMKLQGAFTWGDNKIFHNIPIE